MSLFHSLLPAVFSPACWIIRCKGELHNIYCTVFSGISVHTFPVLERPASLQCSSNSSLQPHLTGKHNRECRVTQEYEKDNYHQVKGHHTINFGHLCSSQNTH